MSDEERVLFEIDTSREKDKVFAVGIPLAVKLKELKVYINNMDVSKSMVIESLRVVKTLK